jgi:2-haloacid dehalogenase
LTIIVIARAYSFFDVNETLLDLSRLKQRIDEVLLTKGAATLWFTTMLQHSLVMTVSDQYTALSDIGVATLKMIAKNHDVALADSEARDIVGSMKPLPAHPDVLPALVELKNLTSSPP